MEASESEPHFFEQINPKIFAKTTTLNLFRIHKLKAPSGVDF